MVEWINKMWYIWPVGWDSALKRMNLEDIRLGKISQSERQIPYKVKFIETESKMVAAEGGGRGESGMGVTVE